MSVNQDKQREEEKALFAVFLKCAPDFAGDTITDWDLTESCFDPPDVICNSANGKRMGVEICQWTSKAAMKDGRLMEGINKKVLKAIGPQPSSRPRHFSLVFFYGRTGTHLQEDDHASFRKAFFDLVDHVNKEWPILNPYGRHYAFCDLEKFIPLNKYLQKVVFCPPNDMLNKAVEAVMDAVVATVTIPDEENMDWIWPAGESLLQWVGTEYDEPATATSDAVIALDEQEMTMETGLLQLLETKADKCSASKPKTSCEEVHLLIAFHEAIRYCPPMFNMSDTARKAVDRARQTDSWPFASAWLLKADEDNPEAWLLT